MVSIILSALHCFPANHGRKKGSQTCQNAATAYGGENRVNILKQVKIGKNWNLYPAVVETKGKLRDKERVRAKIEVHPEGYDYVGPIRPMYEEEEIQSLLGPCNRDGRVLYLCYLLTGLGDKEMRHLTWRDIDFRTQVVRVTGEPLYGFKPMNKESEKFPCPRRSSRRSRNTKGQRSLTRMRWSFRMSLAGPTSGMNSS